VEILANAFERNGDFEKAKDIYIKFSSKSNDNFLIEKSLKRIEKKKVPNKLIVNTNDAIAELFNTIASTFNSDFTNNFSIIYSHFSLYLKNNFEVSQLYLAELLEQNGQYIEANNLYEKIKPSSNFYWHSKLKKARNLELLGDSDKSIPILKEMSNEKQERYDSLKLLGDIYRNHDKYNEAIKFYNEAVSRIETVSSEHWELLYSRGMAYERNNQWNKAEKDFLKIL
jgi:tetratricopeptide (TPR) repeat protein